LNKIIQDPEIDIFNENIFSLARSLAIRCSRDKKHSKEPDESSSETPLIPAHPKLIEKFKPIPDELKELYFNGT